MVVGTVGALALAASANAADLYHGPAGGLKDGPAPVDSWTGFYVGAYGGYGTGNADIMGTLDPHSAFGNGAPVAQPAYNANMSLSLNPDGFNGGGEIGYNLQRGSLVVGLEGTFGALLLKDSAITSVTPPGHVTLTSDTSADTDWLATIRGRIGIAYGRLLIYGTGGAAFTDINLKQTNTYATLGPTGIENVSLSDTKAGWAAGGGAEYKFGGGVWSAKVEFLHADFGSISGTGVVPIQPVNVHHEGDLTADLVQGGLNYHFNTGYEPLK